MSLVILKDFLALLLNGYVMNTARLCTILWFNPWGNWVPNVLIQWSSLLSLSDMFLCALPWSGICSTGYKSCSLRSEANIIGSIEMPRCWIIFISTDIWYVIKHSVFYKGLFHQHIHLHELYIHWCVWYFSKNNLIPQILENQIHCY